MTQAIRLAEGQDVLIERVERQIRITVQPVGGPPLVVAQATAREARTLAEIMRHLSEQIERPPKAEPLPPVPPPGTPFGRVLRSLADEGNKALLES